MNAENSRGWARLIHLPRTREQTPWVPRVKRPTAVWFEKKMVGGARSLLKEIRPKPLSDRNGRFTALVEEAIAGSIITEEARRVGGLQVLVQARSGFGKPMLVSFDLEVTAQQRQEMEKHLLVAGAEDEQYRTYGVFIRDLLDRAAQALWDNPEVAPVALRGRVLTVGETAEGTRQQWDLRDIGFVDEIARPVDLYRRYGSPKSDPAWRP